MDKIFNFLDNLFTRVEKLWLTSNAAFTVFAVILGIGCMITFMAIPFVISDIRWTISETMNKYLEIKKIEVEKAQVDYLKRKNCYE